MSLYKLGSGGAAPQAKPAKASAKVINLMTPETAGESAAWQWVKWGLIGFGGWAFWTRVIRPSMDAGEEYRDRIVAFRRKDDDE